jgi:hypothetical protein
MTASAQGEGRHSKQVCPNTSIRLWNQSTKRQMAGLFDKNYELN